MAIQLSIGSRVRKSPFFGAAVRDGLTAASVYNHMYSRRVMVIQLLNMSGWFTALPCGMSGLSAKFR
jgi:hypothetical protein